MSNFIDSLQLSGTNYSLKDPNATNVTSVTQAEYDALVTGGTLDPTVMYIISDAQPIDISQFWTSAQTNSAINEAVSGKLDTSVFQTYSGDVDTALANKVETSAITTAVTTSSTDSEIPTAKAVNDAIAAGGGGSSYTAGTGIDITNDVISVTGMVATSAVTSAVTSSSTDVVTSGGVYDQMGGMKILHLTQAQYDQLQNKDNMTLYVITNS